MKHTSLLLINFYQILLSPIFVILFGTSGSCRYEVSCSAYAGQAIDTHGFLKGSYYAIKRVASCNPWNKNI